MQAYLNGLEVVNTGIFFVVMCVAALNIRLALNSGTKVGTLLATHSALTVATCVMFLVLQNVFSGGVGNHDNKYTYLGWIIFETVNGISLLFYSLAVRVVLQWKSTVMELEQGFHCPAQVHADNPDTPNTLDRRSGEDRRHHE